MNRILPKVIVETERLLLREWQDSDLEPYARLNADPEVRRYFPKTLTTQESDAEAQRIQANVTHGDLYFWAVEIKGIASFAGFIGLKSIPFESHFTPAIEIGWRLAREHWNHGYATEGARAAAQYAFDKHDLKEIVAYTLPSNQPSRRVMEKIGMTYDKADDFNHPLLPADHFMSQHVLYRLKRERIVT